MAHEEKLMNRKWTYALYGMPAFGLSVVGIPLYIYLPTFYTLELGMDVGLVGLIVLMARLLDMLFDPAIGYVSDRLNTPFGKRKPWIVLGSLVLLVGYYGLIHPPKESSLGLWLMLFSMLTYVGWSTISVPYMALSAEISKAYHDKSFIASGREIMGILGMLGALLLPYIGGIAHSPSQTLDALYTLLLISLPLGVMLLIFGVHEHPHPPSQVSLRDTLPLLWHSNAFYLIVGYLLNALANAIPSTLFLYFVAFILQDKEQSGILLMLYFASGILGLPFWLWLSLKIGKQKAWIASMLFCSLSFLYVPFLGAGDTMVFALIVLASGLCLGADLTLSSSLQADFAQSYEKANTPLSGILFGLWGMCTKLSLALGVGISFGILALLGFESTSPNPASLLGISLMYGLLPIFLKLIAIVFIQKVHTIN